MKKLLCLFAFLITVQTTASHYDAIYHFENLNSSSDDYFAIKLDFDYVHPDDLIPFYQQQVFGFEQFDEQLMDVLQGKSDFYPIFFFEIVLIDTNMPTLLPGTSIGQTSAIANENPLKTGMGLGGTAGLLLTPPQSLELQNFPTDWELGQLLTGDSGFGEIYVLTEITPVPLPAALPLFGLSLLMLTRLKIKAQ